MIGDIVLDGLTSEIVGAPWAVFMLTAARSGQLTWLSRLEVSKLLSLNSAAAHPQNLGFGVQSRTSRIGIDGSCHGTAAAAVPTDTVGRTTDGCKESRGPGSTPTAKDDHVHQLDNANATLTVFKTRRNFYTTCCCCWCRCCCCAIAENVALWA